MSRVMRADAPEAFRVRVERSHGVGYYGPYATLAAARGAATRETVSWSGKKVYPHKIEKSKQEWEVVE